MDELAALHKRARTTSILPGNKLAATLENGGGDSLTRRRYFLSLQSPIKRRMLLKLLAVRFFVGGRKLKTLKLWENDVKQELVELKARWDEELGELPVTPAVFSKESIAKVESIATETKHALKRWEKEFVVNNFRPVASSDKRGRQAWCVAARKRGASNGRMGATGGGDREHKCERAHSATEHIHDASEHNL
jgi:hypothetical protein